MDHAKTTDEHSRALHRIVAVLLALADLAERASGRSPAVRALVVWLLRSGEVLARDYLAGLTPPAVGQREPTPLAEDSATEVLRLAASFRQLAAALVAEVLASWPQAIATRRGSRRFSVFAAAAPITSFRGETPAVVRLDSS